MLRFFAVSSVVLLYMAATQCIAAKKEEAFFCEEKSCDADCRRKYAMSKVDVYGKCDENNECHCYKRHSCNDTICEDLCHQRLAQEKNLHSNCTESQCYCSYDKMCVQSECSKACEKHYPDADVLEAVCNGTLCICKWQENSSKRRAADEETEAANSESRYSQWKDPYDPGPNVFIPDYY
ncbi:hypothetical protein HPB48_012461 [Haemaphysalis longicornis]|uniref:Uncharacterized protein n=1 Tax=Haemaphysalis longicornis TaxID=44386 RepID=A0A9J6GLE9_HAELO|nr:hypothetical protein HPB48_012461 [Haemaphysalis longicornis]